MLTVRNLSRSGVIVVFLLLRKWNVFCFSVKIAFVPCLRTDWPHIRLDVIKKLGYGAPTSIQSQAIPAIMSGRDVIGVAKTGSGKTIAFLLPLFRHIKDQRPLDNMEGAIAIVMTPTRELALQIHRECKPFLKALGLRVSYSTLLSWRIQTHHFLV